MFEHLYRPLTFLVVLLTSVVLTANAQTPYFDPVPANRLRVDASMTKHVRKFTFYTLKDTQLRTYLAKAPLEFTKSGTPLPLAIPLPNGTVETFDMVESPVLAPEIAAKHPDIKTYNGRGRRTKYSISVSFTALGFNAIILGVEGDAVYFDKVSTRPADQLYMTYFGRDAERPERIKPFGPASKCGSVDVDKPLFPSQTRDKGARQQGVLNNTGTVIRSFRLAVAANGEFTQQAKYGGDRNLAFAGVVNYVNRLKAVYKAELSVEFVLVSDISAVYSNTATDPYTNDSQSAMLDENQANLDVLIGKAKVRRWPRIWILRGSGGGVASRGSVCNDTVKAQGVSGVGSGVSFAPIFDDQLFCHEIGHQFGMTHSYNSSIPVCTSRIPETSVEPGAGITIMSYGFTCDDEQNDDNYERPAYGPFLNFHSVSFEQAEAHIAKISCFTSRPFTNTVPSITMPANRTIPKSTPFALSGSATDDDADLTYSWEGTNIGTIVPNATTGKQGATALFRSYEPVPTGTRTFPRLAAILDGSNHARGDKLPSVGIVTTHRLTVRDGYGGVAYKQMNVTVAGNSGPFLETTNLAGSYSGGTAKTITWSVANTTAAPVSCANVNILLSTDGGLTFPTTLVANTPNDGSQSVTLPDLTTNQARIKIASSNNIFFDISNSNFTILPIPTVSLTSPDSVASEPPHTSSGGRLAATSSATPFRLVKRSPRARASADEPVTDHAIFRFERDHAGADDRLTVEFEISGTAIHNVDHFFDDTTHFEAGEFAFDLYVYPGHDLHPEDHETLTLTLLDPDHYHVHPTDDAATITILDNDGPVPPTNPNALTITSSTCFQHQRSAEQRKLRRGLRQRHVYPGGGSLFINGVTGNGQLGQTYSFSGFDAGDALSVQDQASRDTYFVWNFRQACATTPQPPPRGQPDHYQLHVRGHQYGPNGVNFVVGYGNGTFTPGGGSLFINGVTGNGQLGQTYSFSGFDAGVSTLSVQDQASRDTYFVWNFRQACATTPQPPSPTSLTITSFNCFNTNGALSSVNFVVGYGNGTFVPAVAPLLIVGVTGNGQLGQTYSFSGFDAGVSTLSVQDQASRDTYFVWNFRQACFNRSARSGVEEGQLWQAVVLGNPPVSEYAEVELRNAMGLKLNLSLTDMAGRLLSEQPVLVNEANQRVRFRLGKPAGAYLLRVSDQTHQQTLRLAQP